VFALGEDAVLLLVGNSRQWKKLCVLSSGEDFVITREQLESRARFAALRDEYDRQFSAAFDTRWQLGPGSQMQPHAEEQTELDTLHKIFAWAFQSRARAAIYLNNKIVANGGRACTFSADKSEMEAMIGCAVDIKYALQLGEWAQGAVERAQKEKDRQSMRIVDAASCTEEQVRAHAEEQLYVQAQSVASGNRGAQDQAHHNLQTQP
jgi:hypothetical protein